MPNSDGYPTNNESFGTGAIESPGAMDSPALTEVGQRMNAETPKGYRNIGSQSGVSADQYQATMGGQFEVQNGASSSTYATKKFIPGSLD